MTAFVFVNNFSTTLAAPLTSNGTTLTLANSTGLPTLSAGQSMPITLNDAATGQIYEIMYATAISGATLTVTRAQEGTAAQAWAIGDYAKVMPTAGTVEPEGGSTIKTFSVANGVASTDAINLGQAQADFATISAVNTAQTTATTALNKAGFAQAITDQTANRGFGTTYTNPSLTKSMFVSVTTQTNTTGPTAIAATVTPSGGSAITFQSTEALGSANLSIQLGFPVPPNAAYSLNFVTNVSTLMYWIEWN